MLQFFDNLIEMICTGAESLIDECLARDLIAGSANRPNFGTPQDLVEPRRPEYFRLRNVLARDVLNHRRKSDWIELRRHWCDRRC